ncbi:DNA helicase MCM9 [Pseudolycoriella hygida]|uniref:DNA helicase n=1 Tax=Pseudolycoriella hygida TaxID=35572 RepID=A0A9Q0MP91_9DIPT|nr:DNA helicase MCM9 [Pseudolycoriella hygida]
MENYLVNNHKNDIVDMLNNSEECSIVSLLVSLSHLHQTDPSLFTDVINDVHKASIKWSDVLLDLQKRFAETDSFLDPNWEIKVNGRVRFYNLPEQDIRNRLTFPTDDDIGKFVQVKGTVLRATQPKFLQYKTDFICGHCKSSITIEGEYAKNYVIVPPNSCINGCKGRPYLDETNVVNENFITYQEIKVMEAISKKSMPAVMDVTLDDDLVENCQPGDSVTICGTVESRWTYSPKVEIKVVIRANSVDNKMKQVKVGNELPEHLICLRAEWNELTEKFGELGARDILIQSICPDVHGMYLAKLAVALVICSGFDSSSSISGLRNYSHLLLIGDPGLAKSRLLKFAASVSNRSSFVTGSGVSSAGLTAAAVQEEGEWQLEAGALPLADNGICCIDEFNLMTESDKASLHEAMEQQTIHISKAGISCKLNTRCSIIAATNPKNLYSMSDQEGTSSINLGLASSLVSRFDLVLILRDERNVEWDTRVANHILNGTGPEQNENLYDLPRLQAHFAAIREFDPVVTDGASRIIKAYYLACRGDEYRDAGRTTLRFNDSLLRLAKSHAKLLFRDKVTEIDAVIVIMLMESSFGFGRILRPSSVLREEIPLGPNEVQISHLMERLNVEIRNFGNGETEDRNETSNGIVPETKRVASDARIASSQISSTVQQNSVEDATNESVSNIQVTEHIENVRNSTINLESNVKVKKSVETFEYKKFEFRKRQLNWTSKDLVDLNMPTTSTASVHNSITSLNQQQNKEVLQPLNQNVGFDPASNKRIRMDFDDEELDKLFTLDEPIPESTKKSTDKNANECNNSQAHPSTEPTTSNGEQMQNTKDSKRFFHNFTDEDLAVFDDFDF